jgi:peptide/nickel transport system substrate-binding protein
MKNKILVTVLMLSMTLMLVTPIAFVSGAGIPNLDTMTYATIGGPDSTGGSDPAWAYDTGSELMLMQTYEPLFMYANTSLVSFVPLLADWWPGYIGNGNTSSGFITPYNDNSANKALIKSTYGITVPDSANQTWIFHIRSGIKWQDTTYGTVKPHDVVYSFQRGLLQDAISTVQWMIYGPLLGAGDSTAWFNTTGNGKWTYNGTDGLGAAVKGAIQGNDTTGYVAFNLIAPYVPFMQILTQGWAFIVNEKWCVERGCINTTIALSNNPNNYTEFIDPTHYQPDISPLMEPSVVGSAWPMMGTGPYRIITYNTDPHTGFQYYQRNAQYWRGWPCPGSQGYSEYVRIKIVEEWSNRKFQFLSTSSTQVDLTDVPRANCAEMHTGGKDSPVLPGLNLTKILQQLADYYFYNYKVAAGSAFMPQLGGVDNATLLSDRDLREALMYCFNDSKFLHEYFLDEATQPSTFMCIGTAFYNASIPVRQCNIANAVKHFKLAWGGKVWTQGITIKLVYNIGNLARQTIATMISDAVQRINTLYSNESVNLNVVPDGEPWATYLPALQQKQLSCFTVGWLADYPDPDDWAVPFMARYGAFAGRQTIDYGLNTTSLNAAYTEASPALTWGPIPYLNPQNKWVTGLNNTYVGATISGATALSADLRNKTYNELMDIYYAEAASLPTDQGIIRHYERDWVHGWIGGYSMNPVSPGDYFYQMWKAPPTPTTPIYGVYLNALKCITNTSSVYSSNVLPLAGSVNWTVINSTVTIHFDLTAKYENLTGANPIIVTLGLKRTDPLTGETLYVESATYTMILGQTLTDSYTWNETDLDGTLNGVWVIAFRAEPVGVAGGIVYPTNLASLEISWPKMGDLGSRVGSANVFFAFDASVTSADLSLFLQCYKATAPTADMPLGDLGSRVGSTNVFYSYNGQVTSADLSLFLLCYKGHGP